MYTSVLALVKLLHYIQNQIFCQITQITDYQRIPIYFWWLAVLYTKLPYIKDVLSFFKYFTNPDQFPIILIRSSLAGRIVPWVCWPMSTFSKKRSINYFSRRQFSYFVIFIKKASKDKRRWLCSTEQSDWRILHHSWKTSTKFCTARAETL